MARLEGGPEIQVIFFKSLTLKNYRGAFGAPPVVFFVLALSFLTLSP